MENQEAKTCVRVRQQVGLKGFGSINRVPGGRALAKEIDLTVIASGPLGQQ